MSIDILGYLMQDVWLPVPPMSEDVVIKNDWGIWDSQANSHNYRSYILTFH